MGYLGERDGINSYPPVSCPLPLEFPAVPRLEGVLARAFFVLGFHWGKLGPDAEGFPSWQPAGFVESCGGGLVLRYLVAGGGAAGLVVDGPAVDGSASNGSAETKNASQR